VFDLLEEPPPITVAAGGREAAQIAAELGGRAGRHQAEPPAEEGFRLAVDGGSVWVAV
jgi:hypothetical protein